MNLFICYTILQIYIAQKIIECENLPPDECELIFFTQSTSDRSDYYTSQIKTKCHLVRIINNFNFSISHKKPKETVAKVKKKLSTDHYKNIYLASVDRKDVCFILQNISFQKLITFDDGTANINSYSIYFNIRKISWLYRLKKKLFSKQSIFPIDLINQSTRHYTIFQNKEKNVFKNNIQFLKIFSYDNTLDNSQKNKNISIFIGTVYSELSNDEDNRLRFMAKLKKFLQQKNINHYIPIQDLKKIFLRTRCKKSTQIKCQKK